VGFSDFGQADVNVIFYFYFLKLFEVVDVNCSFPMRRYTYCLDLWFKSYEVFKISAQVGACCQHVEEVLDHVFAVRIFNPRIFHMLFLLSKNGLCM
jgi:hypothetical protein